MTTKPTLRPLALLVDCNYGVYVPQRFVINYDTALWEGISQSDADILRSGPEHAHYWETWDDVTSNATYTSGGYVWRLYQDGDLWAYCYELMTDDQRTDFGLKDD